jgi:hypothetical protein
MMMRVKIYESNESTNESTVSWTEVCRRQSKSSLRKPKRAAGKCSRYHQPLALAQAAPGTAYDIMAEVDSYKQT